ncbi:MAG: outer membrane lipoprotein carrier protein LolA [Bacteroidales bacterium]|jgi:outer membrane lipoprotein-sorting protein|nr:outer membrane lipoprotein carrier protein LolA [Bacteroidales bacterium]
MNNRLALSILFIICLAGGSVGAQDGFGVVASENELKQRLNEASDAVQTLSSHFTQIKYIALLDEKIHSEGMFFYKKSDCICLEYSSPASHSIVINRQQMKIVSDGKTNIYDVGKNKMMAQMNMLLAACMTGNFGKLTGEYRLSFQESDNQYRIHIQPLANRTSFVKDMDILLNKQDLSVQELKMTEPSDDYTLYTFTGKKKNIQLPASKFKIK